jgi:hypothetical protein
MFKMCIKTYPVQFMSLNIFLVLFQFQMHAAFTHHIHDIDMSDHIIHWHQSSEWYTSQNTKI